MIDCSFNRLKVTCLVVLKTDEEVLLSFPKNPIACHLEAPGLVIIDYFGTPVEALGHPCYDICLTHNHAIPCVIAHYLGMKSDHLHEDTLCRESCWVNEETLVALDVCLELET